MINSQMNKLISLTQLPIADAGLDLTDILLGHLCVPNPLHEYVQIDDNNAGVVMKYPSHTLISILSQPPISTMDRFPIPRPSSAQATVSQIGIVICYVRPMARTHRWYGGKIQCVCQPIHNLLFYTRLHILGVTVKERCKHGSIGGLRCKRCVT